MVYWLSLDVVEQRAEEERRKTAVERKGRPGEEEKWQRGRRRRDGAVGMEGRKEGRKEGAGEGEGETEGEGWAEPDREGRRLPGDYGPRRPLVYGSADAHHLPKKTCCSKRVHFARGSARVQMSRCGGRSPIVSHSLRPRVTPHSSCLVSSSRLFRD